MSFHTKTRVLKDLVKNIVSRHQLSYIVEPADWAIAQVGREIRGELNKQHLLTCHTTTSLINLKQRLIHFGSLHTLSHHGRLRPIHPSNVAVASIFHLLPDHPNNYLLKQSHSSLTFIHTASTITKNNLIALNIPPEKIKVIPLGVDTKKFTPATKESRVTIRKKLGLPENSFIIGSFQKDGTGWQTGNEPKREKGPDILIEVAKILSEHYPIHFLLAGPSRGYVTNQLKQHSIPFTATGYLSYSSLPHLYHALDCYLITSRIEGGPLSLLESWASGIPVVTTNVGMVPDLASPKNALVASNIDEQQLANHISTLIKNLSLRVHLAEEALTHIPQFSWPKIAKRYYDELYEPLRQSRT